MQTVLTNTSMVIVIATIAILLFVVAYVLMTVTSSRRIIQEQQRRIDEIQKSEERFKALFENSLAGMMKFDYRTWIVLDANQALLELFTVQTVYDLQRVFTEFPAEKIRQIERSLEHSGIIDGLELTHVVPSGITRRYFFSARKESTGTLAHAVVVLMTAEKKIG